jgi:hypothetical protein
VARDTCRRLSWPSSISTLGFRFGGISSHKVELADDVWLRADEAGSRDSIAQNLRRRRETNLAQIIQRQHQPL